jgi:hypothetical protein
VLYTRGNAEGDDDFKRAAYTYWRKLRDSGIIDPSKDKLIIKGVTTKADFVAALQEASGMEEKYGKIEQLAMFSHGGPLDGPVFEQGVRGKHSQYYTPSEDLKSLPLFNWSETAEAKFFACNSGFIWSQAFADTQGIPTSGFTSGTSFSGTPDGKSKGYILADVFYIGPLYMIPQDGKGMTRRLPKGTEWKPGRRNIAP